METNDQEHVIERPFDGEIAPRRRGWFFPLTLTMLAALLSFWYLFSLTQPPEEFTGAITLEIPYGSNLGTIADTLAEHRVIKSPTLFMLLVRAKGGEKSIPAGAYLFKEPLDLFGIAQKLSVGEHGMSRVRVTIPEGSSLVEMSEIFTKQLPQFDPEVFAAETKGREGYLFPDTYFFFSTATTGPIIRALEENFSTKTAAPYDEAIRMGKDWHDILTMASLIEEETVTPKDRRLVSGILWKRMKSGMRLQVDAPFVYLMGKGTSALTEDDLTFDSPYNTYRYDGLPPGPISNPGLDAIDAALHPETSPYFYYLSDKAGTIYYAKTFDEHKINKEKHLR